MLIYYYPFKTNFLKNDQPHMRHPGFATKVQNNQNVDVENSIGFMIPNMKCLFLPDPGSPWGGCIFESDDPLACAISFTELCFISLQYQFILKFQNLSVLFITLFKVQAKYLAPNCFSLILQFVDHFTFFLQQGFMHDKQYQYTWAWFIL